MSPLNLNLLLPGGASGLSEWADFESPVKYQAPKDPAAAGSLVAPGGAIPLPYDWRRWLPSYEAEPPQPRNYGPPMMGPAIQKYLPPELSSPVRGIVDLLRLTGEDMSPAESVGYGSLALLPGAGPIGRATSKAVRGLESLAEDAWRGITRGGAGLGALGAISPEEAQTAPLPRNFWSVLDEVVRGAPAKVRSAQEWRQYLKPGRTVQRGDVLASLKKDELQYSDLERLFAMYPEGPIPRDTVTRTLEERRMPEWGIRGDQNTPSLGDDVESLMEATDFIPDIQTNYIDENMNYILSDMSPRQLRQWLQNPDNRRSYHEYIQESWDLSGMRDQSRGTQYSQYTTAGPKTGYQENLTKWGDGDHRDALQRAADWAKENPTKLREIQLDYDINPNNIREVHDWLLDFKPDVLQSAERFTPRAGHFDSEPNVLSHSRASTRTGPNGEKIRYVEEIQSDWHQQARDEGGYRDATRNKAEPEKAEEDVETFLNNRDALLSPHVERLTNGRFKTVQQMRAAADSREITYEEYHSTLDNAYDAIADTDEYLSNQAFGREAGERRARAQHESESSRPPAAPFSQDYAALELKKQLAQAIEDGDEFLAWTPGEEQIDRYSGALKQRVSRIGWEKTEDGKYNIIPYSSTHRDSALVLGDKTEGLDEKGLRNLVGKEMADKIIAGEPKKGVEFRFPGGTKGHHFDSAEEAEAARRQTIEDLEKRLWDFEEGSVGYESMAHSIKQWREATIGPYDTNRGELTGDNLTIGGAGMRHFYDTALRKEAEKLAKQYGGELVETDVVKSLGSSVKYSVHDRTGGHVRDFDRLVDAQRYLDNRDNGVPEGTIRHKEIKNISMKTPAIRITPEMRERFKKAGGFPLYGVAGAAAVSDWSTAFEPD